MTRSREVLRESRQRRVVREVVEQSRSHPTAQRVFEEARRVLPSISLGTVYRNLRLLVEQGFLRESKVGNRQARFEGLRHKHYHIWCLECGRLEDLTLPYQRALDRRVQQLVRYDLREHRMEFYGVCPECRRRRGRFASTRSTAPEFSGHPLEKCKDGVLRRESIHSDPNVHRRLQNSCQKFLR